MRNLQIPPEIFNDLNDPDRIEYYEKKYSIPKGIISVILSQKIVRGIRSKYHVLLDKRYWILEDWLDGKDIISLARKNGFSPVNLSSNLLMELGCPKKSANWLIRNPDKIPDDRLRDEITNAVIKDIIFSPLAHSRQMERADLGENIIQGWLEENGADFLTEDELTKQGNPKTPDFYMEKGFMFQGTEIFWIDSKALYGDKKEHSRHERNQFKHYNEMYGQGLVVYWYGYDNSLEKASSVQILDGDFFSEKYPEGYREIIRLGKFIE